MLYSSVAVVLLTIGLVRCYDMLSNIDDDDDAEEPLILTPTIRWGSIEKARSDAEVTSLPGNVRSYSGYFTVNETCKSNMFFWFFPAENNSSKAPVILWLQGGPGASSLLGLFVENGPYFVENGCLKRRPVYWSKSFNVIYVDNPVGTGFSFTTDEGLCKDEKCIGENLYVFTMQFFVMFPELRNNDFYVAGQSYACKYVAALGYTIHKNNIVHNDVIKLKGIAVGNGLCDPINMMDYGTHLYQLGLINDRAKCHFDQVREEIIKFIEKGMWEAASESAFHLIRFDPTNLSYFQNVTGFTSCYHMLRSDKDPAHFEWKAFVERQSTKRSLHIGKQPLQNHNRVFLALKEDLMKSVAPILSTLVERYKVLIYSGQLDLIIPYASTVNFLKHLDWSGCQDYLKANREIWRDSWGAIAGYVKTVSTELTSGSLTEVLIRNAGHFVPQDQPQWAFDMISGFVHDSQPFISNLSFTRYKK